MIGGSPGSRPSGGAPLGAALAAGDQSPIRPKRTAQNESVRSLGLKVCHCLGWATSSLSVKRPPETSSVLHPSACRGDLLGDAQRLEGRRVILLSSTCTLQF